jgi:hypothetical protein
MHLSAPHFPHQKSIVSINPRQDAGFAAHNYCNSSHGKHDPSIALRALSDATMRCAWIVVSAQRIVAQVLLHCLEILREKFTLSVVLSHNSRIMFYIFAEKAALGGNLQ